MENFKNLKIFRNISQSIYMQSLYNINTINKYHNITIIRFNIHIFCLLEVETNVEDIRYHAR